ncbi:MAG: hypothetical protein AB7O21_07315 [Gammaproteobacteria bacterium]
MLPFRLPIHVLVSVAALAAVPPASARPVWPTPEQVSARSEQFVYDRLGDGQRMLLGPAAPRAVTVPPGQSCAALYERRVALLRAQYDYKPAYTDDPRNRAAVFIGTIFTPAFYYLAFSGVQAYNDAAGGADVQAEIDALRYASAAQQCFVD